MPKPYMKAYQVDTGGKDLMVLDVLELLKGQMKAPRLPPLVPRRCIMWFRRYEYIR